MKKRKKLISYEEKYLLTEIRNTKSALAAAISNFENAIDPYLIDSSIYALNSVQKKYMFLIERARESNIDVSRELIEEGPH